MHGPVASVMLETAMGAAYTGRAQNARADPGRSEVPGPTRLPSDHTAQRARPREFYTGRMLVASLSGVAESMSAMASGVGQLVWSVVATVEFGLGAIAGAIAMVIGSLALDRVRTAVRARRSS